MITSITKADCNSCAGVFEHLLNSFLSPAKNVYYQYTSMDTFYNGILRVGNNGEIKPYIRLNSMSYLNDSLEARIGHEMFKSIVECVSKKIPKTVFDELCQASARNTFEASFTSNKDCLQMWSTYAQNGKGVCVGLNMEKLIQWDGGKGRENTNTMVWAKCLYETKDILQGINSQQLNTLKSVFENSSNKESDNATIRELIRRNLIVTTLHAFLVALAKNKDYEYENESRLIILPNPYNSSDIKYRLRPDNILAPYIDVEIPLECIEEVWVGPNQNVKAVKESLERYLEHVLTQANAKHRIKVIESNVAFRTSI